MVLAPPLHADPPSGSTLVAADATAHHAGAAERVVPNFATVYQANLDFVWRSLRRLGVPPSALDDAHQEVFLVAYRRLDQFQGRSTVRTWLFGIILNVVRHHKRSTRRESLHDSLPETVVDVHQPGPMESAAKNEAAEMVQAFLDGLDADKRSAFILAELEQMTVQEVAEATETNVRTVYSRLRVARQQFEQAVARYRARDGWRGPCAS